jgi:RimJ/RimL family protein N-acetyltransferase
LGSGTAEGIGPDTTPGGTSNFRGTVRNYRIRNSLGIVGELAPLCMEHAFSIAIIGGDPAIRRSVNLSFGESLASAEAFVKRRIAEAETDLSATFAVLSDEVVIGCCSLHSYSVARDEAEMAFWLSSSYWGLGWGSEMCRALVTIAKQRRHLTTLIARCFCSNLRAIRILQKCGFQHVCRSGVSAENICTFSLTLNSPDISRRTT